MMHQTLEYVPLDLTAGSQFVNSGSWFESSVITVVVVLRSPIHANEPSEYNGMLYRTSNRVLNNGIKVIILICMDGTSQYHHYRYNWGAYWKVIFSTQLGVLC